MKDYTRMTAQMVSSRIWLLSKMLHCFVAMLIVATGCDSNPTSMTNETLLAEINSAEPVPTPPSITKPSTAELQLVEINEIEAEYQCKATGYPKPQFKWFVDDREIVSETAIEVFDNGKIIFKSFMSGHNGYYQCKAANRYGTSVSDKIHFLKQIKPKTVNVETIHPVVAGEPFEFKCDLQQEIPNMFKRWYHGKNQNQLQTNKRVGVDNKGTLRFAYVTSEDSTQYFCAWAPREGTGRSIYFRGMGSIKVTGTGTGKVRPTIQYGTEKAKGIIGGEATLECFFASDPVSSITWSTSNNEEVKAGHPRMEVTDFGRKLVIKPINQEDEGYFTCKASNQYGNKEQRLYLNVTSPPMATIGGSLVSDTKPDKSSHVLNCKTLAARGENIATPIWYRNGVSLTSSNLPDPVRYRFNSDQTQLTITDLHKGSDTAGFQCNVSNSEGYQFFDAYLRVINAIEIYKRPADVIEIKYGDVFDLTILYKGDACCPLKEQWYFNNTLAPGITQFNPFQYDRDTNTILFNTSSINSQDLFNYIGKYSVKVSDPYQSKYVNFDIVMQKGKTESVVTATASSNLWWIGLVCGLIAILAAIIIVVVVYKSYYPGSTYKLEEQEIKHNLNPEEDLLNQSFHEI